MSENSDKPSPAFQAQFEEIARLEQALRSGELTVADAAAALHRLNELMGWHDEEVDIEPQDVEYLYA